MPKILVAYGTVAGQTEKIAQVIAEELKMAGLTVDLIHLSNLSPSVKVINYDGTLIGAPIHYSSYPPALKKWVKFNAQELAERPGAFFSVYLGILQRDDVKVQNSLLKITEDFLKESGWKPNMWTTFPGALLYSKYGLIKRQMMKFISRKAGGNTDTSHDYEYTNWEEVRRFARQFGSVVIDSRDKFVFSWDRMSEESTSIP